MCFGFEKKIEKFFKLTFSDIHFALKNITVLDNLLNCFLVLSVFLNVKSDFLLNL